jgi:hypothetical protein
MSKLLQNTTFISLLALFSLVLFFAPVHTYAATIFNITTLRGQILGSDGKPLRLADITAVCDGHTQHAITGANGNYVVIFVGQNVCEAGDTVTVTATKDGHSDTGTGTVQVNKDGRFIDLNFSTIDFSVPEFGFFPGVLAAIASAGAYLALRRKNKFLS